MKTRPASILALACTLAFAFSALADTWIDPDTGIERTYTINNQAASVCNDTNAAIPTSTAGAITIPSSLGGYPVTSIGDYAFNCCRGLTCVTIPEERKTIGILLCSNMNDSVVRMSLPETNDTILAAEYKLRLPAEEKLLTEIAKVEAEVEQARESKR